MFDRDMNREAESFLSRLEGAVRRYGDKGISSAIGFTDDVTHRLALTHFRESGFSFYAFHSPWSEATRLFLTVGDDSSFLDELVLVRLVPDKFHTPTHRDYMGAMMALGLDRRLFGDLVVTREGYALLILWNKGDVLSYVKNEFTEAGRARLKCELVGFEALERITLEYHPCDFIISSARIDCVVSAVTSLSRAEAKALVKRGEVRLFSAPVFEPDKELVPGDVFSVRGAGKYRFDSFIGTTKKDRLRIRLMRYGDYIERKDRS